LRPVNVETTVRYTRWRNDNYGLSSRPDQIELLVGFTNATSHLDHPFGNRVSIGGYLGLDLLHDYTRSVSNVNVISINPDGSETFSTQSFVSTAGDRSLMIGPSIEATISHGFSIEAAAIYRHLQQSTVTSDPSGVRRVNSSLQSWQFPILAKYGMPSYRGLTPFIEAGPSFRLPVGLSRFGFSSGLGIDLRLGTAKISPGLRYTRWQTDASGLKNDEADLLIGVRF
jgi:hypothetical protein